MTSLPQATPRLVETPQRVNDDSMHCPLTGLANRTLLEEHLKQAIAHPSRADQTVAILFVDIDHYQPISDEHGQRTGDSLLIAAAGRLSRLVPPGGTLGRLAGDKFMILCEGLDDSAAVELLAARVDTAVNGPYALNGTRVVVRSSVGISFAGQADRIPTELIDRLPADVIDLRH